MSLVSRLFTMSRLQGFIRNALSVAGYSRSVLRRLDSFCRSFFGSYEYDSPIELDVGGRPLTHVATVL